MHVDKVMLTDCERDDMDTKEDASRFRKAQAAVAALKLPRPENVDQLETEIKERGVSIQKARRKRIQDYPTRR